MLDALRAPSAGDRFIERVVAIDAAKSRSVACTEPPDRLLVQDHFAGRMQRQLFECPRCALRLGIETPDGFKRIAEEIEAYRRLYARRIKVDNAAAHRKVAGIDDRSSARKA